MFLLTILLRVLNLHLSDILERALVGGQFPQRPGAHLLCRGKVPDTLNEEKGMDLGIDYRRQSVLPQCFMKSIHQYQSGDEVRPKPK